jgi:glycosyltransferase involved in cell wall biosynthesis
VRASVQAHLVSDVPVGVFLSGGLDSGMLASLAAATGARPQTITLGFAEYSGTANDETPLAEALARQLGTQHSTTTVRRPDFEAERDRLLAAMDQPSIDGINTWFVARAAAAQGLKVALSGVGGDELFGSYPSFRELPRITRWTRPLAAVPALGVMARRLSEPLLRRVTSPKYAGLLEYGGTLGSAYMLRRGLYMPWELPRLMDPDMARDGWRDLQAIASLDATCSRIGGSAHDRLAVSALEMSCYMRQQLLNDADWAGMAHSVEIRLPLVDVALLRAAAPWIAAHPELAKRSVARAAAPDLPRAILEKPKTGFVVPVREWLAGTAGSSRGLGGWARTVHGRYGSQRSGLGQSGMARVRAPRVLVSTLAPGNGGVSAMTRFVVDQLAARGFQPVIAHYAPYSVAPALSVPFYRLFQRVPGRQRGLAYGGCEAHGIGAWLPELEFTHYVATRHWRQLMDSCDAFVAVSGNVLAATPFRQTGRPYLAWVATDWDGDRRDRVRHFPTSRRLLDTLVNAPVIRALQKRLLSGGTVLSLSEYTAGVLGELAAPDFRKIVLPVPIDTDLLVPSPGRRVPGRVGFAGRFSDPRKNIGLLLQAVAILRRAGQDISVLLLGEPATSELTGQLAALDLAGHVTIRAHVARDELRDCLQTLDAFVLPSHQEGLCIAALEAMACGVPVVSTRCGGPEEFVIPGVTGSLVESEPQEMASAIGSITRDAAWRACLSRSARNLVEQRYAHGTIDAVFAQAFEATFPALGSRPPAEMMAVPLATGAAVA